MKNKILTAVFLLSWLAVFCIAGSVEQYMMDFKQAVVLLIIAFAAIGISGFLSGLLTSSDKRKK